jgi:integrase
MRGHVRKRGKSWSFVMDTGRDPETGKRQQRWSSGHATKKAAEQELRKALGRLDVGADAFPERITVRAFFDRWLVHLATQGKPGPRTRHEYARVTRTRIVPAIGGLELTKVRPAHVQHVIDTAVGEGVKPTGLRATMSTAFEMALRWSLIPTNPVRATSAPSRARPKLQVPNAQHLRDLIETARSTPWETPMLLSATCGTRRSETLGLTWACVDLDAGTVRIERTLQCIDGELVFLGTKTERSKRTIPLPAFALARLRQHRADQMRRRLALGARWVDRDLVCEAGDGRPLEPDSFSKAAPRLAASIGVDGMRLHDVRHGVATMLARSGLAPFETSELLGHSSPTFTAAVYQHADRESVERARRGIEQAFAEEARP